MDPKYRPHWVRLHAAFVAALEVLSSINAVNGCPTKSFPSVSAKNTLTFCQLVGDGEPRLREAQLIANHQLRPGLQSQDHIAANALVSQSRS